MSIGELLTFRSSLLLEIIPINRNTMFTFLNLKRSSNKRRLRNTGRIGFLERASENGKLID